MLTKEEVYQRLNTVLDPETGVSLVDMGLVYDVGIEPSPDQPHGRVHIIYTLTTSACPLAEMISEMFGQVFTDLEGFNVQRDLRLELTFEPPWTIDRLSEAARAELGF